MKLKTLFIQLYKYAIENDITGKNYAQFVDAGQATTSIERKPFTRDEIETLWKNIDVPYVDSILIMIYSGMHVGEMLEMKTENIDGRIMKGGLKSKAGKDRSIPIHEKIMPLIDMTKKHLVTSPTGKKFSYNNYIQRQFTPIMKKLGMNHLPHDCRHTTATALANADVESMLVKLILGHSNSDITERVYTHKTHKQLIEAVDKIDL